MYREPKVPAELKLHRECAILCLISDFLPMCNFGTRCAILKLPMCNSENEKNSMGQKQGWVIIQQLGLFHCTEKVALSCLRIQCLWGLLVVMISSLASFWSSGSGNFYGLTRLFGSTRCPVRALGVPDPCLPKFVRVFGVTRPT